MTALESAALEGSCLAAIEILQTAGIDNMFELESILSAMIRNDEVYANSAINKFSSKKLTEDFRHYSEILAAKYGEGAAVDLETGILKDRGTVGKLSNIRQTLLSKNRADAATLEGVAPRCIEPDDGLPRVVFTGYPRCGSTFSRQLFEIISTVSTGSDGLTALTADFALQAGGFRAEYATDYGSWIIKSHYPQEEGSTFNFKKLIAVVRNPYNCVESFLHLIGTGSHNLNIDLEAVDPALLTKICHDETKVWHHHY